MAGPATTICGVRNYARHLETFHIEELIYMCCNEPVKAITGIWGSPVRRDEGYCERGQLICVTMKKLWLPLSRLFLSHRACGVDIAYSFPSIEAQLIIS